MPLWYRKMGKRAYIFLARTVIVPVLIRMGDGFTELPKLKNQTVGFRSYLKTSTYSKLTFEYHHMNEYRRGGNLLDRPPHEADIAEQLEHSIDGGGLKFDLFSKDYKHKWSVFTSAQNTDRDSYTGRTKIRTLTARLRT